MVNPDQKNVLMEIFMRKILLASTALVAVAGISAASAEISLSGGTDVSYTSVSDDQTDNATAGENGNSMASDTDLAASYQQQQTAVLQFL